MNGYPEKKNKSSLDNDSKGSQEEEEDYGEFEEDNEGNDKKEVNHHEEEPELNKVKVKPKLSSTISVASEDKKGALLRQAAKNGEDINFDYDVFKQTFSGISDTNVIIEKLHEANKKLNMNLKVFSKALDKAVERQAGKIGKGKGRASDPDLAMRAKDKEINNAQIQINQYKKEIASLKSKMDSRLGFERVIQLENELKAKEKANKELEKEIRSLRKVQSDQGKELEKISGDAEFNAKIKQQTDELHVYKEKLANAEEKHKREEKNTKAQFEHMIKLEDKCRELTKQLNNKTKHINTEPAKPHDMMLLEEKIKEIENMKQVYEKSRETTFKRHKKTVTVLEKKIVELEAQLDHAQKEVRERDQEIKLTSMKLKDLQKMQKFNQLKPLETTDSVSIDKGRTPTSARNTARASIDSFSNINKKSSAKLLLLQAPSKTESSLKVDLDEIAEKYDESQSIRHEDSKVYEKQHTSRALGEISPIQDANEENETIEPQAKENSFHKKTLTNNGEEVHQNYNEVIE